MTSAIASPAGVGEPTKFMLVVLAHQRARQLQNGARPRVETAGHKFNWVAMAEVSAGTVSWALTDLPKPVAVPRPKA